VQLSLPVLHLSWADAVGIGGADRGSIALAKWSGIGSPAGLAGGTQVGVLGNGNDGLTREGVDLNNLQTTVITIKIATCHFDSTDVDHAPL
jgi:hypothetical protein